MTAADPRAVFADLIRTVIPPAYGADFDGMDALCNLLVERETQVLTAQADEFAAQLGRLAEQHNRIVRAGAPTTLAAIAQAYDHAAQLARDLRVPYCGHELHSADGGACPRCGHDPYALDKVAVAEAEQVWTGEETR